jgi:hypothetical protein
MYTARTCALGLATVALVASVAAEAAAQQGQGQRVFVHVMIVKAGPQEGSDDPECRELRKRLGPMDVGPLHMMRKSNCQLGFGENCAVPLPAGGEIRLKPLSIHKQRLNMQLQMPGWVNSHLRMRAGKPLIVNGPRYQGGQLLIQIVPRFQSQPAELPPSGR